MRYLSFDIESTGLEENCLIIEFAAIPFDSETQKIEENLSFHNYVKCPPFEELKKDLAPWVREHNKDLIETAHNKGHPLAEFKNNLTNYLESTDIQEYFGHEKIVLFGKSMNAIDLPFLNRDLGWEYMRKYFVHRVLDLSSFIYGMVDLNKLPKKCIQGSALMEYFNLGNVAHTALEDARNTAILYLKILEKN